MPKQTPIKPEVKKIEMLLKCILTDEEKLAAGRSLADAGEAVRQLEADLDRIKGDFKAKLLNQEGIIGIEQGRIRSGYDFRQVLCEVTFEDPEKGKKTIRRMDTNAIHEVQAMTGEELQRMLALEREDTAE